MTLSYSSQALAGRIHDSEKTAVADGWSLAEISVVRMGVKLRTLSPTNVETYHPNDFRLVFNGAGYQLIPESIAATANNTVRYYVENAPTQNMDTFFYDSFGRLTKQTRLLNGRSYALETTGFDLLNRPLTVKYPTTEVVTLTYDREGENTLKAGNDWVVDEVRYNARGQMTLLDRGGSNSNTYYGYFGATGSNGNNNFRLFTIQHGSVTDAWPDMTYTYDTVGNILTLNTSTSSGNADNQTFEYDDLSRLKSAVATGGAADYAKVTYTYSEIGNILTFEGSTYNYKDVGWNTNCTAPGQEMPHAVRKIGNQYFCYDANGNMTERFDGTTTTLQQFDVENRLVRVIGAGLSTTDFAYDASGQRVKTVEPGGKTTYFPFPNYEETVVGGSTIKRSSYALAGQVVAFRVAGDPVTANNGLFFIYGDHLGSTSVLQKSGETQPVAGSWARYRPYGSYRGTAPTQTLTDRDFTGQRENREIGLLYYQARYYLPGVGRFISADTIIPNPANPQSLNRYTYVNNNSLKFIDPSGHRTCSSQQATSGDETCNQNTGSSSGSSPKTQPQNGCNEVWCKNSGPSNLPINNWYPNADVEQALANTQQVLDWLSNYTGSNWWGGGPNSLPSETQLAAWLLMEEGSTLQWDDHLLFMARIIRYRLRNGGLTVENLSGFTAFFNPDGGSEFSANDWSLLVLNGPGERYTSAIKEAYSMKNYEPLDANGKLVLWWWKESEAKGVSNGYLVNGVQPKTIVAHNPLILENFYFGNYEQCVAANFGGC